MKAFVLFALLGYSSAIELKLKSENNLIASQALQEQIGHHDPKPTEFTDGKPYVHRVPPKYREDSIWVKDWERQPHDELMNHLIKKFAKEGKDEEGKPNGRFFINKKDTLTASEPYVKKYRKDVPNEKAYKEFIELKFEDLFNHFDVLSTGFIEVEQMGRFIKSLCDDQTIPIQ